MTSKIIPLPELQDTENLGQKIANLIKGKKGKFLVYLKGNLGSGKTTLAQSIIKSAINKNLSPTSPTFNIVSIYSSDTIKIYHFDLYRLKHQDEIYEIGIEEALDNCCIIEWPEIGEGVLPESNLEILLSYSNGVRSAIIYGKDVPLL